MRPPRRDRSDEEIRAHDDTVDLLVLIAVGKVTRSGTGILDPYLHAGVPMSPLWLKVMASEDLIFLPMSGPPRIAPRALDVLDDAGE